MGCFLVDTHWLSEARMLNFDIRLTEDTTILTYLGKFEKLGRGEGIWTQVYEVGIHKVP